VWRKELGGQPSGQFQAARAFTASGPSSAVSTADYDVWRAHFGQSLASGSALDAPIASQVPEPATLALLAIGLLAAMAKKREQRKRVGTAL
jgi:hypothetical protein